MMPSTGQSITSGGAPRERPVLELDFLFRPNTSDRSSKITGKHCDGF